MPNINWIKRWSASDDGTVFGGNDLGVLQADIENNVVQLAGTQTITGDKDITGALTLNGSRIVGVEEWVTFENAVVSYENSVVFYT